MTLLSWVLLSGSGTGGIYAKLANEAARHNCARASPIHNSVARHCEFAIDLRQILESDLVPTSSDIFELPLFFSLTCPKLRAQASLR